MYLVISNKINNELKKSLGNNAKLDYFKNKLLAILDKKEKEEEKEFHKSWDDIELMQKSRAMPVGTIQTWKGKKFKKMPNKKWVRVYDTRNRSAEISIARLKGKVRRATSVDELFEIVSNNIHRFEDENGKTLDIVQELKAEVDKAKGVINKDKPKFDYEGAKWEKEYNKLKDVAVKLLKDNGYTRYSLLVMPKLTKQQKSKYADLKNEIDYNGKTEVDLGNMSDVTLKAIMERVKYNKLSLAQSFLLYKEENNFELLQFYNKEKNKLFIMENILKNAKNWDKDSKKKKTNTSTNNNFDFESLPSIFKTSNTKNTFKKFGEYLNSIEIKDNRIKTIMQNFGNAVTKFGKDDLDIIMNNKVLTGKKSNCYYNPVYKTISIPKFLDFVKRDYASVIIHEFGHRLDFTYNITENMGDEDIFTVGNEINDISDEVKEAISIKSSEIYKRYVDMAKDFRKEFNANPENLVDSKSIKNYNHKIDEINNTYLAEVRERKGINDIYDALSGGRFFSSGFLKAGHGREYYSREGNRREECFADFFQLKLEHPEQLEILKKDKPKVYEYLEKCLDNLYDAFNNENKNYNN